MKATIERGQIWWVNLDPTRGAEIRKRRPCVVLSANPLNRLRLTAVVIPLSSSPQAAPPVVVSVPSAGAASVAVIDQIRAVDKSRFLENTGSVSKEDLAEIERCVRQVLQLGR